MSTAALDLAGVRSKFPALDKNQVYFDNAGGSQTLRTVAERIMDYLLNANVQLGASYAIGKKSTSLYNEGYAAAAKYINAMPDEIVLGSSTTQLFRNVSNTLDFNADDEMVISALDHEANIAPWVDMAVKEKLILKWWLPNQAAADARTNPKLLASDLKALLSPKTRLVACTHASNILGTIHDIKTIASTVHSLAPDALVCVDAVAYAPHRKLDVKDTGVDLYSFSWYKVYGPHIAILYASPKARSQMKSLGHFFNRHETLENKIGLAGASYELVAALPAVSEYLGVDKDGASSMWDGIMQHEAILQETLLTFLNSREDITVWGDRSADPGVRVPTISFTVQGWNSQTLVESVEKDSNFGFRWGNFYSVRLIKEILGLEDDGIVRVSMVHYNTVEEVQGLIAALEKVLSKQ